MKRLVLVALTLLGAGCNFDAEVEEYCRETHTCEPSASGGYCVPQGAACQEGECCGGLVCGSSGVCRPATNLSASPAVVDFGHFPRGAGTAVRREIVVSNTGTVATAPLRAALVEASSQRMSLDAAGCAGRALAPGERCTVQVSFLPAQAGRSQFTLRLEHDFSSAPLDVPLVGITGVALNVETRSEGSSTWDAQRDGRLVSEPAGLECSTPAGGSSSAGSCSGYFLADTQVVLSAPGATGWGVARWSGACQADEPRCVLNITGESQATAFFGPALQLSVENLDGTQGVVSVQGAGECRDSCAYVRSGRVTLTASVEYFRSSPFLGWDGACAHAGEALSCTLELNQLSRVVARFAPINRILVVQVDLSQVGADLAGADAACQAAGRTLSPPDDQYRAWLSSPTQSAAQRLGTARGWVNSREQPFADTVQGLTEGKIFHPLDLRYGRQYVTGTSAQGASGDTCGGWTSQEGRYTVGRGNATTGAWTQDLASPTCSSRFDILCFGTRYRTPSRPHSYPNTSLLFLSSPWVPAGGVSAADTHCQQDAAAAGLAGRFKALLAPAGQTMRSRVPVTATPYCARPDGVYLGECLSVIEDGPPTSLNVTARGEYVSASADPAPSDFVWTGGAASRLRSTTSEGFTSAADTCDSWRGGAGTVGKVGRPEFADWQDLEAAQAITPAVSCSTAQRVHCVQVP